MEVGVSAALSKKFKSYVDFDIEATLEKPREDFIYISSILKVKLRSSYPERNDVIFSMWIAFHNRLYIDGLSKWNFDV